MKNVQNELHDVTLLPCNKKQLAREMGISLRTLQRKMKAENIPVPRGLIAPQKKAEILKILGWHEMARNSTK